MTLSTVSVDVPQHVYMRLKNSAIHTKLTIKDVLTSAISIVLPPFPELSEGVAAELAEMIWLSDEALWSATEPTFTQKQQERLAKLNHTVDVRSLSSGEVAEQQELLTAYEHSVLLRSQAFNILNRRGHQIPSYADLPAL